ncbi:histone deacetylase family protein [Azospirillum rugosum]|uniref:histone deacetylase family protein n=1 Tax=Azospirillum rugosum TaxID=416170 RepID=UPI001AE157B0|nr:histone deacetylase family protein [Azospirillum rugosum]
MKIFFSPRQRGHRPGNFLVSGQLRQIPDVPERVESLLMGATSCGHSIHEPEDFGVSCIAKVHTAEYIAFLETAYDRWSALADASSEVVPNVHPRRPGRGYPRSIVGRAGYHLYDLACPITPDTWTSALWGAHSATSAALQVRDGGERSAYAICRPPGHHAGRDFAGGFCYLNNAAVAAAVLRDKYQRVAIVDIDVHHGNGTQDIFYDRGDVMTISLHGDPAEFYPFFWGYETERGEGDGLGANVNLALPRNAGDNQYLDALHIGLSHLRDFRPQALVVALGLDSYKNDPLAFLQITTTGFERIARVLSSLRLPTVLVQEGGYLCEDLGMNLASFLTGFEAEQLQQA